MLEKAEQGIWPSFVPLGYLRLEMEAFRRRATTRCTKGGCELDDGRRECEDG